MEITGPTDRKLVINALNSGARGFMADFEDANSPTWANQVGGHVNLIDAIEGTIEYTQQRRARSTRSSTHPATLLVRPRGWHLPEKHLRAGRRARARARCATSACTPSTPPAGCTSAACGVFFYLPKLEHHLEARLWNDVLELGRGRARPARAGRCGPPS